MSANGARPAYTAARPSSSSMRRSWLYFATRSERAGAPVLIWPQFVATARSAMVTSSVSPERWLIMQRRPLRWARSTESRVSVSEPIRVVRRAPRPGGGGEQGGGEAVGGRAYLVDLHQQGVGRAGVDAALQPLH